ncbi:hypothetical protein CR513_19422, partial [Mucuna pruriens]
MGLHRQGGANKLDDRESLQDSNAILMREDPGHPNEPIKDDSVEAKALVEVEKCIERERP